MELIITDADGFDAVAKGSQVAVISFSRREVTTGQIGDALTRLMNLTDSREQSERFAHGLAIHFEGWDADARELFETPEVIAYFRALTAQWSAWYHFLLTDPDVQQFPLLFALLCDVDVHRARGQIGTQFRSQQQVARVERQLEQGTIALYQHHGWSLERCRAAIATAQLRAFGG
jgi:hypothetical protein